MEFLSQSSAQTKKIGEKIAQKPPFILALRGELGAGKTTFLQGYAKGLNVKEKILSPTFLILKKFPLKNNYFIHIDCYRIQQEKEILNLGWEKMINQDFLAIEWPERIKKILPKNTVFLNFQVLGKKQRKITKK